VILAGELHEDRRCDWMGWDGVKLDLLIMRCGLKRWGWGAFCVATKNFVPSHQIVSSVCLNGKSGKPLIQQCYGVISSIGHTPHACGVHADDFA
jgi:hypothetical protein